MEVCEKGQEPRRVWARQAKARATWAPVRGLLVAQLSIRQKIISHVILNGLPKRHEFGGVACRAGAWLNPRM